MLVDAGNSRLKWALLKTSELSPVSYEPYVVSSRLDVIFRVLVSIKVKRLLIVHVLGEEFELSLQDYCQANHIQLHIIKSQGSAYGITNAYDDAKQLGADRFVALVAVHQQNMLRSEVVDSAMNSANIHAVNSIVISCGTAVTIDALNDRGEHLGGLILPGLQLWKEVLIKGATLLESSDSHQVDIFAKNTKQGIAGGSLYGLAGAIDHIGDEMSQQFTKPVERIISGGCAEALLPYFNNNYKYKANLVMQGLKIISEGGNA